MQNVESCEGLPQQNKLVGDSDGECEELCAPMRHDGGFVEDKNDVDTAVGRADSDDDTPIAHWHLNLQGSSAAPILPQLSNGIKTKPPFPTVIPKFALLRLDPSRCKPERRPNYNALRNMNQHIPFFIIKWFLPLVRRGAPPTRKTPWNRRKGKPCGNIAAGNPVCVLRKENCELDLSVGCRPTVMFPIRGVLDTGAAPTLSTSASFRRI